MGMKVILMVCVLAVCLPSIKSDDAKCAECCGPTAAPTTAASSTAAPTGSTVKPSSTTGPASTVTTTAPKFNLAEATGITGTPDKCDGYNTVELCGEKCGAATFTMSVAFV